MPPIDRYIYLRCPAETLAERLRTRGMDYEGELGLRYAARLKALYDDWAQTLPRGKTLILDDGAWTLEDVLSFIESPDVIESIANRAPEIQYRAVNTIQQNYDA